MEQIDEEDLANVKPMPLKRGDNTLTDEEFKRLLGKLENPVMAQKEMAVKIKHFLDKRMDTEMKENQGCLSDHTRRWVESYNNLLEKIQKALYGEKSINLHLHKVTHSQIAARMRYFKKKKENEEEDLC